MGGNVSENMKTVLDKTQTLLSSTSSGKLMDSYKSLIAEIKTTVSWPMAGVGILIKLIKLITDPKKGFILLSLQKNEIVALLSDIHNERGLKGDIPDNVRPMVNTLEKYVEKMEELTKKTEGDIKELIEVVFHDFVLKVIISR